MGTNFVDLIFLYTWVREFRRPKERYAQYNFLSITLKDGRSIMVWGGISITAFIDLVVLNNVNFNVKRYILDILEKYVVP